MTDQSLSQRFVNFAARTVLARYPEQKRIARIILGTDRVDPVVVLPATESMRRRIEKCFRKSWRDGQVTHIRHASHEFSLCATGVGAPATEIILTALLAGGARTILRFDVCGSLSEHLPVGALFVADRAYAYDGVSKLYYPHNPIEAHSGLVRIIMQAGQHVQPSMTAGAIATVDFFFAQTLEDHRAWGSTAQAVDMETSAIYAMCAAVQVPAVSVMCVSDVKLIGQDPFTNDNYNYAAFRTGLKKFGSLIPDLIGQVAADQ
ncbi:hypothetical protein JXQ70_00650 [bacterium]|nr:hypothetical protein [bacterium]